MDNFTVFSYLSQCATAMEFLLIRLLVGYSQATSHRIRSMFLYSYSLHAFVFLFSCICLKGSGDMVVCAPRSIDISGTTLFIESGLCDRVLVF